MATFDYSNLTAYTNQLSGILLRESVLVGDSLQYVSVQTGIKHIDSINILNSNLIVTAGHCNTLTATGSNTPIQRNITVCPLTVEDTPICKNKFETYWMGMLEKEGSYNPEMPAQFNELYLATKVDKIGKYIEKTFWIGSTSGTYSTAYNKCAGIVSILQETSATASVISSTYSGALTTANAITIVNNMITLIPEDVKDADDLTLFMSYTNFETLMFSLASNNYYTAYDGQKFTRVINNFLNSNVRIVATAGLNGFNQMILTPSSNLWFGTDSYGEALNGDGMQFFYDQMTDAMHFRAKFKVGTQVAFPAYVVIKNS